MPIKYNRNRINPELTTDRNTSVNTSNGWVRYNPPSIPTTSTGYQARYGNNTENQIESITIAPCDVLFTEGCDNGSNFVIADFGSSLINVEISTNSSPWSNQGCGAVSPLSNYSLGIGDIVSLRGVCSVNISLGSGDCGVLNIAANTNMYIFYDVTSMDFDTAKLFKTSIENWAANTITNYEGNIYHIPVLHEKWVLWPQYPITGTLPPYYQVSGNSPTDMLQYNTLFNQNTETWDVYPGKAGPEDSNSTHQRIPWAGPLWHGDQIVNYNASLPTPQTLQSNSTSVAPASSYNRTGWNTDDNGDIFMHLPQEGHVIPNHNGSGNNYVLTAADAADLTDIKAGDYLSSTEFNGELDCGGSQAQFIGGDVDALVVCLSDESIQSHGTESNQNSKKMARSMHAGMHEGYHGYVKDITNSILTDVIPNPSGTYNDPKAIAFAKTHYFAQMVDKGRRFVKYNGNGWTAAGCNWGHDPSLEYDEFSFVTWDQGLTHATLTDGNKNYGIAAFDWENGLGGVWYITASVGSDDALLPPHYIKNSWAGTGPMPSTTIPWFPVYNGIPGHINGFNQNNYVAATPLCGQPWCPNASVGHSTAGCYFSILSQPHPGYIADVKYHMDNIYPLILAADSASGSGGCKFSTFFYVVMNDNTHPARVLNPLTTVAALEGTTLGSFDMGQPENFSGLPTHGGGDISLQALGYFNPYGENAYWHPTHTYGFDIANHALFNGYGFKNYAKGGNGYCGYNVSRGDGITETQIATDLTSFVSGGGTECGGSDCINITVVDTSSYPIPNYTFDFNGTNYTTDSNGEWGDQVTPGIYSFMCNSYSINTSPAITGDHTDMNMATVLGSGLGCNSWDIEIIVKEQSYTVSGNCTMGCTDGTGVGNPVGSSAACNYDPTAGIDDGSCIYGDCSDMCPDTSIVPYTPYSGLGTYPNGGSSVFPFAFQPGGGDAYYSPYCPNCCVGGNTGILASDCVDCLGVCGGSAVYDSCGVCGGSGPDACGLCFGDGTSCVGCMDPMSTNFDPTATTPCNDCCEVLEVECKLKEVARKVLESCAEDCDDFYKNMLLEASMLYSSLLMISGDCSVTDKQVNGIVTSINRLLVKVECGMCKNC